MRPPLQRSSSGEISQIASDLIPLPQPFIDSHDEFASFHLGRREVINIDRGMVDDIGADLAKIRAIRANEVEMSSGTKC